jgi:hypothetical protein
MRDSTITADAWARIHVLRGAPPQHRVLRAGEPVQLIIGSDPGAQLPIDAPCVAPRQLDVLWDGANLWLEDKLRLGRTFVNGRLLNEWVLIRGEVIVSFGWLRLWMAAAGGVAQPLSPDFAALERACGPRDARAPEPAPACRRSQTGRFMLTPELQRELREAADLPA